MSRLIAFLIFHNEKLDAKYLMLCHCGQEEYAASFDADLKDGWLDRALEDANKYKFTAFAETPEKAICLAALMVMEVFNEMS